MRELEQVAEAAHDLVPIDLAQVDSTADDQMAVQDTVEDHHQDEQAEEQSTIKEGQDTKPKEEEVVFPKKAVNAISRRDKQIGKLRAQNNEMESRLETLQTELEALKNPAPPEPQEQDFENYGDYLKALAQYRGPDHQPKSPITGQEAEQMLTPEDAIKQAREALHYEQRTENVIAQADLAMKEIPDFQAVILEYEDVIDSLPVPIVKAFLDAENAPMAFYTLASEGKIDTLSDMPAHQAAMEIARAEIRGLNKRKDKQITQAPPPIKGAKAAGKGQKGLQEMSADELVNWVRS